MLLSSCCMWSRVDMHWLQCWLYFWEVCLSLAVGFYFTACGHLQFPEPVQPCEFTWAIYSYSDLLSVCCSGSTGFWHCPCRQLCCQERAPSSSAALLLPTQTTPPPPYSPREGLLLLQELVLAHATGMPCCWEFHGSNHSWSLCLCS